MDAQAAAGCSGKVYEVKARLYKLSEYWVVEFPFAVVVYCAGLEPKPAVYREGELVGYVTITDVDPTTKTVCLSAAKGIQAGDTLVW